MPIDPQVVRVQTSDERLDATMQAIHAWLDAENIQVVSFTIDPSGNGLTLEIGFRSLEDAERFRRHLLAPAR